MNHAKTLTPRALKHVQALLPKGLLQLHASTLMQLHQVLDPLMVALLMPLSCQLLGMPFRDQDRQIALVAALVLGLQAQTSSVYRSQRLDAGGALLRRVLELWAGLYAVLMAVLFLFKIGSHHSRQLLLMWSGISLLWLLVSHVGSRSMLREARRWGRNTRMDAYIGTVEGFHRIKRELAANPWLGKRLVPVKLWHDGKAPEPKVLEQQLRKAVKRLGARQWLLDDCGNTQILRMTLAVLEEQNNPVLMIPQWLPEIGYAPRASKVGDLPAVVLWEVDPFSLAQLFKLIIDRLTSAVLLILLAPLLLAIAIAITTESTGPVIFRQRRYGLNGEAFNCFKFRTMSSIDEGPELHQATPNDPRVTGIGRFLRRSNLDELPQLINVLRGEMSLVGPRPHAAAHNEYYRKRVGAYMRRHSVRPGLTGLAQVLGLRGQTETLEKMQERVKSDLNYIQNWSLMLDLRILLLTLLRWRSPHAY